MQTVLTHYHRRHSEPAAKLNWFIEHTQSFLRPQNKEAPMIVDNPGLFNVLYSIAEHINGMQQQMITFPRVILPEEHVIINEDAIYMNENAARRIEELCGELIHNLLRDYEELWDIFNSRFLGLQRADDEHAADFQECCGRIGIGLNQATLRPTPYEGLVYHEGPQKSYWQRSKDYAIHGEYAHEPTALGIAAEIAGGFIPVLGQATSVRDLMNILETTDERNLLFKQQVPAILPLKRPMRR